MAMISTYHMALVAMISMIPLYLQEFHGFSSSETGIAYAVMVLAGAIGQPFIGRLSDRVGRRKVIVLGNGLAAAAAFSVRFFEQEGWLFAILGALLIGVALLECVRSAILAAAVEYAGTRDAECPTASCSRTGHPCHRRHPFRSDRPTLGRLPADRY